MLKNIKVKSKMVKKRKLKLFLLMAKNNVLFVKNTNN